VAVLTPRVLLDGLGPHSQASDVTPLLDHRESEEAHLLALLRRRELAPSIIEAVARHDRWNKRQSVRAAIVSHVKAPRTLALRLLPLLFWQEQLRVSANIRLAMPLRVAAEARLRERLPELELGERVSMARRAPVGLVPTLARDGDARVLRSLFHNPRAREQDILQVMKRDDLDADVLRVVSQSERWVVRPAIRDALVCHANTPVHVALSFLARIPKRQLESLLGEEALPRVVAIRAHEIVFGERS